MSLPGGGTLLGIHASPGRDDGPGINADWSDSELREILGDCEASVIVGGHTHVPTDRVVDGIRVLNPGSVGIPREPGRSRWLLFETIGSTIRTDLRSCEFDVGGVIKDLHERGYPNATFLQEILTGTGDFPSDVNRC
jgi:hypothetical protein